MLGICGTSTAVRYVWASKKEKRKKKRKKKEIDKAHSGLRSVSVPNLETDSIL